MNKLKLFVLAAFAVVIALGGYSTPIPAQAAATDGYIRFIHVAPGAPAIDIYLDNAKTPIIKNLAFGAASEFVTLPGKSYGVALRATGEVAGSTPLYSTRFVLVAQRTVNVVALGLIDSKNAVDRFRLEPVPLNRLANTNGKARVQFIHAVPNASSIDILSAGSPIVRGLKFDSYTLRSLDLPPGTYDFAITPAGLNSSILVDLSRTRLEPDTIYSVLAIGRLAEITSLVVTAKPQ